MQKSMEELYSTVNKVNLNTTTYEINTEQLKQDQQQQYDDIDISQQATFPLMTNGVATIEQRTKSNETFHVDTIVSTQNGQPNSRKTSFEIYENHHQLVEPNPSTPIEISTENYTIKVQPSSVEVQNDDLCWQNIDTYLHIFLTFFFGHFASFLFFDGIIRNIECLILFERPVFYIFYMIFSITYIAFTVWMLTILWRWWRNKSLMPHDSDYVPNVPFLRIQQKLIAKNYVFIAVILLSIGFLIYLILGIMDNHIKEYFSYTNLFFIDRKIFMIRLFLWILAIFALLALNRSYFMRNILPKRFKRTTKNKPQTIIYEMHQ